MQKIRKLVQSGRHRKAIPLLKNVCSSEPKNAEAHYLLGCSQAQIQNFHDAIKTLKKCTEIQPNVAQAHFALAGTYLALGKEEDAENSLNETLKINNSMAEAYVALAKIRSSNESIADARRYLEKALKINPNLSDAHLGLGLIEQKNHNYDQSILHIETALYHNPKSEKALYAMGSSLVNLARTENRDTLEQAKLYYQKAIRLKPDYLDALTGLAIVYDFCNEPNKAIQIVNTLINKKVHHPSLAVIFARTCKHSNRCEEAIDYIDELLKQPSISTEARKTVHFAAGKVLDQLGNYDYAFQHYKAGNDLETLIYDSTAHSKWTNSLINVFSTDLFNRLPRSEAKDPRPIFIVGMPRSGTSLTEQILAAHSQIYGAGELTTLDQILTEIPSLISSTERFPYTAKELNLDIINHLSDRYLKSITELSNNALRITDKMPFNYYYLGIIEILFPEARIIHCKRNPLDTCLSIYFQGFSKHHAYSCNLYDIGSHYHEYERLMAHWKKVLSLPLFELEYEELVANQETIIPKLIDFCNLEWDENCFLFYKSKRAVNTPSYDQVRQPLYNKSIDRWKNYDHLLNELKKGLKQES